MLYPNYSLIWKLPRNSNISFGDVLVVAGTSSHSTQITVSQSCIIQSRIQLVPWRRRWNCTKSCNCIEPVCGSIFATARTLKCIEHTWMIPLYTQLGKVSFSWVHQGRSEISRTVSGFQGCLLPHQDSIPGSFWGFLLFEAPESEDFHHLAVHILAVSEGMDAELPWKPRTGESANSHFFCQTMVGQNIGALDVVNIYSVICIYEISMCDMLHIIDYNMVIHDHTSL